MAPVVSPWITWLFAYASCTSTLSKRATARAHLIAGAELQPADARFCQTEPSMPAVDPLSVCDEFMREQLRAAGRLAMVPVDRSLPACDGSSRDPRTEFAAARSAKAGGDSGDSDACFSPRYDGQRARYGKTWSARLPGHPRYVVTSDRGDRSQPVYRLSRSLRSSSFDEPAALRAEGGAGVPMGVGRGAARVRVAGRGGSCQFFW
jgi:hypothetical protein